MLAEPAQGHLDPAIGCVPAPRIELGHQRGVALEPSSAACAQCGLGDPNPVLQGAQFAQYVIHGIAHARRAGQVERLTKVADPARCYDGQAAVVDRLLPC